MRRSALLLSIPLALFVAGLAEARDKGGRGLASRLFISPMGEPFRSDLNGDPEATWFAGADADHDGRISLAELQADARRWFAAIDRGHKGEIDPDDIDYYENKLVPEIRVADARGGGGTRPDNGGGRSRGRRGGGMGGPGGGMGGPGGGGMSSPGGGGMGGGFGGGHRGGGRQGAGDTTQDAGRTSIVRAARQGAARYSYLDFPEPLTAADANLNRGIDANEMARAAAERFALLDKNGDGYLEKRELPRVDTRTNGPGPRRGGLPPGGRPPQRDRQLGGGDREQD